MNHGVNLDVNLSQDSLAAPVCFGPYTLLPEHRQLLIEGVETWIGPRAFDLLAALIARAGQLVSKRELLEIVWPGLVVQENNLQVQIFALRKILGPNAIATIPGRGYRLAASVADPVAADHNASTPDQTPVSSALSLEGVRLPTQSLRSFGREHDITIVKQLLDEHPLVTITGAGGIGKTHLSQAIARAAGAQYRDGIAWVDLAALSDASLIPGAVARAMGKTLVANMPPLSSLIHALEYLQVLVVLDGAERMHHAIAHFVAKLGASAPGLRFLVSSQVRLNIADEQVFRLPALASPDRDVSCHEALEYSAVALFVTRAQACNHRFTLTEANVRQVVNLCRRLDGIPLALELAAARLPSLGLVEVTRRLDERFRLLNTGSSGAPTRQQTLAAAFEWSHALLSAPAQILYRRLCVFVGGFTLADLTPVVALNDSIDEWGAMDLLGDLVGRSLVELDAGEASRYGLRESARAFALEKLLAAGEGQTLHQSHLMYFLQNAEAARKSCDTLAWPQQRDWLTRNYANVRAALEWALMGQHDVVHGAKLVACLHMFWLETAQTHEADYWLMLAFKHLPQLSRLTQARILLAQGEQSAYRGQYEKAEVLLAESVALLGAMEDARQEWANACVDLGAVKNFRNAFESAMGLLEQAVGVQRALGNKKAEGVALHNLAYSHFSLGRIVEAEALFRMAADYARAMHDEPGLASRLSFLAECANASGKQELALKTGREALQIQRGFGPSSVLANWLQRVAKYELANGNVDPARVSMAEALAIFTRIAHPGGLAECIDNCAQLALATKKPTDAALLLGFAQAWRATHKLARSPIRQAQAQFTLDDARLALGADGYAQTFEQGTQLTLEQGLMLANAVARHDRVSEALV